ncbi:cytochrome b-245 chaperone 1 isoform X2 [Sturnira hondurensis]|uniref:cytochrome b-245 chaperone 1 isoform X2 n=1 Tax=Sturnira hondurensis TaxID=192404 RepID=UPI0018793748|nr:cytochrome b-245 chaperone 1 isoform X2 [Sturnira hondurensis]
MAFSAVGEQQQQERLHLCRVVVRGQQAFPGHGGSAGRSFSPRLAATQQMHDHALRSLTCDIQVVVLLHDIQDVNVEEEKVRYFGRGFVVVLRSATGFSHPLTQSAVMGHRSDVEAIAKLITAFLELHRLESPGELSQSSDSEADGPGGQS